MGLLLLRAAVAVTAIVQGEACLAQPGNSAIGRWIVGPLAIACGALLLLGFLTKATCVVVGLGSIGVALLWFPVPPLNMSDSRLSLLFVIIMAAAIMLLGPGAYSLDARLFGRREIIIPHATRAPKS
jgi:uncharacterized membrane protein YphA (DoxX/SURF4 family)